MPPAIDAPPVNTPPIELTPPVELQPSVPATPAPDAVPNAVPHASENIYDRVFWLTYLANTALVAANTLTFRFGDFVNLLGGREETTGAIVSAGVFGALAARLWLGQGIDRYGTRLLWTWGTVLFVVSMSVFLWIGALDGWIYVARIGYAVGISTMFTCSMVHVQSRVPASRRTEVIGNLGSSGFVGMVLGAQLGDLLLHAVPDGRTQYVVLFSGTMVLGVVYFALVTWLTRGDVHERPAETPAAHRLLFRHWPGNVVLVAMTMGVTISVTTVFLTRYVNHLGMANGFGTFFTGYAVSAFAFRITATRWSRSIGRHKMILLGLGGHTLGFLILSVVANQWQLLLPALCCGFGHALLFPAVVSLGAGAFPKQYRGTGTTLTLGFFDLGMALSAPILGRVIDHFDGTGFVPMLYLAATTAVVVSLTYAMTAGRRPDEEAQTRTLETGRQMLAVTESRP